MPNSRQTASRFTGKLGAFSAVVLIGVSATAFLWGYLAHRDRIFPYELLRQPLRATRRVLSPASPTQAEVLTTLPYLASADDPHGNDSGVLIGGDSRAFEGYTLYSPRIDAAAYLIRMDGEAVWQWSRTEEEGWQHIELLDDGGLLVTVKDRYIERIDQDSNPFWRYDARVHHDLWVSGQEVWTLTREPHLVAEVTPDLPTLVDKITILDLETGRFLREIDVLSIVLASEYRYLLPIVADLGGLARAQLDVLHTNHVEVFDGSHVGVSPLFEAGNVLISMRQLSSIAILDVEESAIRWLWGPSNVAFQHHPTLTPDGTILLFDNGTRGTKRSRLWELIPRHDRSQPDRVVWRYTDRDFFSLLRGGVQRLPNGNTLVTESDTGHVFEVTKSGERVWEFATPHFDEKGKRSSIWRATRYSKQQLSFLF